MPFFKKKRNSDPPKPPVITNGVVQPQKVVQGIPPLQNFVPPPDVVADALAKTNRRSASSFKELWSWARDYFCAFMKNEGLEELVILWSTTKDIVDKKVEVNGDVVDKMKSLVEKYYTHIGLDGNNSTDSLIEQDCLAWIQDAHNKIYETLQETYLPRYLESKFHVKCQVDLFTNGDCISLYDILLNQTAMFYFMEYVDQEGKREVLEFWLGATNFTEQFSNTSLLETESTIDWKTAQSDAMVLYEKYISLQAPHPLGLRDEVRCEVERLICTKEEIIHCFGGAVVDAFAFLHVSYLEGFLKSSLFLAFLSDLIGSLSSTKCQQAIDTSSVGSSSSVKSYPHSGGSSITSPTPRQKTKLSLGRVNALGKFEADTDLELVKQESSIAKTVKKLVNFDEKEKAKEELAWQVAAMIVNEVTSVTMGPVESKIIFP